MQLLDRMVNDGYRTWFTYSSNAFSSSQHQDVIALQSGRALTAALIPCGKPCRAGKGVSFRRESGGVCGKCQPELCHFLSRAVNKKCSGACPRPMSPNVGRLPIEENTGVT